MGEMGRKRYSTGQAIEAILQVKTVMMKTLTVDMIETLFLIVKKMEIDNKVIKIYR